MSFRSKSGNWNTVWKYNPEEVELHQFCSILELLMAMQLFTPSPYSKNLFEYMS